MSIYRNDSLAVARLQDQILEVKEKLNLLSHNSIREYTGNLHEDTLVAVATDNKRDYWESRLIELEELLYSYLRSDSVPATASLGVTEGDFVVLSRKSDDKQLEVRVTSHSQLYPEQKCVTPDSPIGLAIMGKIPGDIVSVTCPGGGSEYQVIEIDRDI